MTDYSLPTTMNLWTTDDNAASMMEAFMASDLTSFWPTTTPSPAPHAPPSASSMSTSDNARNPNPNPIPIPIAGDVQPSYQESLQQRLQALIEGARESWTYAIFWQLCVVDYAVPALLGWGDGYYKGEENKGQRKTAVTSAAEQLHRKKVLRELNSLISGTQAENDAVDEEVTDTEWFFLLSMTQSFKNGNGLPGQAFFNSAPVWVAGQEKLAGSHCKRVRQAQVFGLQTIVCLPSANGVVELGSTEVIFQSLDLVNKVNVLFDFNGGMEMAPMSMPTDHGENDPSALWLTDPSASGAEIKDSVDPPTHNNHQTAKQIVFQNPSSCTLTENPSSTIHALNHIGYQQHQQNQAQTQGFFNKDLNFSNFGYEGNSVRNGNSHSCKPESGEILSFGESKKSSCSGNGNLFTGQLPIGAGEENKKKRSPASRDNNDEGMLSFNSGVILPSSANEVKGWCTLTIVGQSIIPAANKIYEAIDQSHFSASDQSIQQYMDTNPTVVQFTNNDTIMLQLFIIKKLQMIIFVLFTLLLLLLLCK